MNIEEVKEAVKDIDPDSDKWNDNDDGFRACVIMISPAIADVSTSAKDITEFTGYEKDFVEMCVSNLVKGGIFIGDKIAGAEWIEEDGAFSIILDSMVALGLLETANE